MQNWASTSQTQFSLPRLWLGFNLEGQSVGHDIDTDLGNAYNMGGSSSIWVLISV